MLAPSPTSPDRQPCLVLVGNRGESHVGAHLASAVRELGIDASFLDVRRAYESAWWYAKLCWHLGGRRPPGLARFSREVLALCRRAHPKWLLTTGFAPVDAQTLAAIGGLGVNRVNYLTDDPWNPAHRAPWFQRALPFYDRVCSPRRANLDDLRTLGCPSVAYLRFAYSPSVHFPEVPTSDSERKHFDADVVFAGGADRDRIPYLDAVIRAGFRLALYGGYWDRFSETRGRGRGHADAPTLRKAIGGAKVALCLVRRANRDGHAMRSFEVAATGACMLVEDTAEHREIFGEDGVTVVYFNSIQVMLGKLRWLVDHEAERQRLTANAYARIVGGRNTYRDRLQTLLEPDPNDLRASRAGLFES